MFTSRCAFIPVFIYFHANYECFASLAGSSLHCGAFRFIHLTSTALYSHFSATLTAILHCSGLFLARYLFANPTVVYLSMPLVSARHGFTLETLEAFPHVSNVPKADLVTLARCQQSKRCLQLLSDDQTTPFKGRHSPPTRTEEKPMPRLQQTTSHRATTTFGLNIIPGNTVNLYSNCYSISI